MQMWNHYVVHLKKHIVNQPNFNLKSTNLKGKDILEYIDNQYQESLYLYLDYVKYNIDNSNIKSSPITRSCRLWCRLMNLGMKIFNVREFDIDMKLKDKQIIRRYGLELKIVSLPGHTNGSIGVLYKDFLFAGDALINRWHGMEVAFQNQDCEEAILSYEKIQEINPNIIFVGHDKEIIYNS